MKRAQRLRKGREFDAAYAKGTVYPGPLLVVRVMPNGLETTRWGFAVGKRLVKQAAHRNRLRRRLRELARTLPVRLGFDVVVTARAGCAESDAARLRAALVGALRRAALLEEA
jgi:ribonuclease P protein component